MNINLLFERSMHEIEYIQQFNEELRMLSERKRNLCTINSGDSKSLRRRKCNMARRWGVHHIPLWATYNAISVPDAPETTPSGGGEAMSETTNLLQTTERHLPPIKFILPDAEYEWDEATRYEEFKSRTKREWFNALKKAKLSKWSKLSGVKNYEQDIEKIDTDRRQRVQTYINAGFVELPLVGKWKDGRAEVIGGATRIAMLTAFGYDPFVLVVPMPDTKRPAKTVEKPRPKKKAPRRAKKPRAKEPPKSSTERVRRYYKRHPKKVRNYLRKTQDDRVARNRDRRKAVAKYGKKKMKNHDVHHPNGAKNGGWRLARKDHGRDKVNETFIPVATSQYDYILHPTKDVGITFSDIREFIEMGVGHGIDIEHSAPNPVDSSKYVVITEDMIEEADTCKSKLTEQLNKLQQNCNLSDDATLSEYMTTRWIDVMNECPVTLQPADQQNLIDRWLHKKKSARIGNLSSPEAMGWALKIDDLVPTYEYTFLYPFNKIISTLVVESVKRSLKYLSLHNKGLAEIFTKKIVDELTKAKQEGDTNNEAKMNACVRVLESCGVDGIIPADGIILTHKGVLYKHTGPFSPLQKIGGDLTSYISSTPHAAIQPRSTKKVLTIKGRAAARDALQQIIINPETNNPIPVIAAIKYHSAHPAHVAASRLIRTSILQESIDSDLPNTGPIPSEFSEPTANLVIDTLGLSTVKTKLVGSIDMPISNDIDVAVDTESMQKYLGYEESTMKELMAAIEETLSVIDSNIKYNLKDEKFTVISPIIDDDGKHQPQYDVSGNAVEDKGYVAIDFMLGNIEWMKQYLVNGDESEFAPIYRNILLSSICDAVKFDTEKEGIHTQYEINPRTGLYKKTIETQNTGEQVVLSTKFLSISLDQLAMVLFGQSVAFEQIDTYEKLLEMLLNKNSPLFELNDSIFTTYSKKLNSVGRQPPPNIPAQQDESPRTPIVIFPGKFQPYHAGHDGVYGNLINTFGEGNVYLVTTKAADPYKIDQKLQLMTQFFDVPEENIMVVKDLLNPVELTSQFPPETPVIFVVTEIDQQKFDPRYFKPYAPDTQLVGQKTSGYLLVIPPITLQLGNRQVSSAQLNAAFGSPSVPDQVKQELFIRTYGKVDSSLLKKMIKNAMTAEEERELERMYASPPPPPQEKEPPAQSPAAPPAEEEEPSERGIYDVGEIWFVTSSGMYGAKNANGQIAYFRTREGAEQHSRGLGKIGAKVAPSVAPAQSQPSQ
jgi:hypothetical protein